MAKSETESIEIVLNGDRREVPPGLSVEALLKHLRIDASRVAVEVNRQIVRKRDWAAGEVLGGAEVEVVQFVGGG